MQNEITAEMLAREMCRINGQNPDAGVVDIDLGHHIRAWEEHMPDATGYLILTRALAALQAEQPKPKRMRCWRTPEGRMTDDADIADAWRQMGDITPGWFTADEAGQ